MEGGTTEAHLPKVEVTKVSISHPYNLHEAYSSGGLELPFTRKVQGGGSVAPGVVDAVMSLEPVEPVPVLLLQLFLCACGRGGWCGGGGAGVSSSGAEASTAGLGCVLHFEFSRLNIMYVGVPVELPVDSVGHRHCQACTADVLNSVCAMYGFQ